MLTKSKINSIESKISEALINDEISHEDVITTINEEKNYWELKENIRMVKNERSDTERNNLIDKGKRKALMK